MNSALTMGQLFTNYAQQYIEQFKPPAQHLKVIHAIRSCRTSVLGGHAKVCTGCGGLHVFYNSCGNRHCPQCQAFEKEKWVEKRKSELLPVPYLHLVFTIPHQLNPLVLSNDRLIYHLLFKAAWLTIRQIAADKKWMGAQTGMMAVLHTWGSNLSLHPHLHCIIPCGGISPDQQQWINTRKKGFLAPNKKVMAPLFRAIFMRLLTNAFEQGQLQFFGAAEQYQHIDNLRKLFTQLHNINWNVFAKKPFGGPAQILNYLSRYTHRVAISNHRLISLNNDRLTFSVKDYKQKNEKGLPLITTLHLNIMEFIRRFLLHVLPKGFQRIRYFGILAIRNRKSKLRKAQQLLKFTPPPVSPLHWKKRLQQLTGINPDACPFCGAVPLRLIGYFPGTSGLPGRSPPALISIFDLIRN